MQGARQRWITQALKAEKISFVADGVVKIDILKYEIR